MKLEPLEIDKNKWQFPSSGILYLQILHPRKDSKDYQYHSIKTIQYYHIISMASSSSVLTGWSSLENLEKQDFRGLY